MVSVLPSGGAATDNGGAGRGAKVASAEKFVKIDCPEENASQKFPSNKVSTTKYTPYNFIFKNLWIQFQKLANVYFVCVGGLEVYMIGYPSYLMPLLFILSVTATKDILEDISRRRADRKENNQEVGVFSATANSFRPVRWKHVKTGDIVKVCNREMIPADLILMASSNSGGLVYVSTMNLDGETNLKLRKVHPDINLSPDLMQTKGADPVINGCRSLKGSKITCEAPNKNLETFEATFDGSVQFTSNVQGGVPLRASLARENVVLRGCQLRNSDWIVGVVVNTGSDTKIQQNVSTPPVKGSTLMKETNKIVLFTFIAMLALSAVCSVLTQVMLGNATVRNAEYVWGGPFAINESGESTWVFFIWIINLANFVPISLYVTLDLVKFAQSLFINWDVSMYDADSDTPAKVKSLDLNEELGVVNHIFSDKTGTLTCNKMQFMKASIQGKIYGLGITEVGRHALLRAGKQVPPRVGPAPGDPVTDNVNFVDPAIWPILDSPGHPEHAAVEDFFLHLALNHDVMPEQKSMTDAYDAMTSLPDAHVVYSASSPDEGALVSAARHFGYFFHERRPRSVRLKIARPHEQLGQNPEFEVLNILAFSSKRKRSSVVIRRPDGSLVLYCKGADNVIFSRRREPADEGELKSYRTTKAHLTQFALEGLRTLVIAKRDLDPELYRNWSGRYQEATLSVTERQQKMEAVMEELERDLQILGVTGIEDCLQDGVSDAIRCIREAGVKVWVLTGDKVDTAVNIGYACNLLTMGMPLLYLTKSDPKDGANDLSLDGLRQLLRKLTALADASLSAEPPALIVDTYAVSAIEKHGLDSEFLLLASRCMSVLCARVSPSQKAEIVHLVRAANPRLITLAIGDGANDVPMIQTAHIGVGISGQEGMQAVNSSDYAIAQFRFLKNLLLVHGRWSARRIGLVINYMFYKNLVQLIPSFFYGFWSMVAGQSLYYNWLYQTFNIIPTALPILVWGIMDRDVDSTTALRYPTLYTEGTRKVFHSLKISVRWMMLSVFHSVVAYFIPLLLLETDDLNIFGSTVHFLVVVLVNLQLAITARYITWLFVVAVVLGLIGWLVSIWFFGSTLWYTPNEPTNFYGTAQNWYTLATVWLSIIAGMGLSFVTGMAYELAISMFFPKPHHIAAELQRGHGRNAHPNAHHHRLTQHAVELTKSSLPAVSESKAQQGGGLPNIKRTKSTRALLSDADHMSRQIMSLFRKYDENRSGAIDSTELLELLKDGMPEHERNLEISEEALINFIRHLENNEKATHVSKSTFSSFAHGVFHGDAREGMQDLVGESENLMRSLLAVVEETRTRFDVRKKELAVIFDLYDSARDGSIDADEFLDMLSDISGDELQHENLNRNDMEIFITAMDVDGNGRLGKDEFVDYMLRGMSMTETERTNFSRRSPTHARLQLFVTKVLQRLES